MKKVAALLALALAAVALVACGGDDDETTEPATPAGGGAEAGGEAGAGGEAEAGGPTVEFEADPGGALAYTTEEESTTAGQVTIELTNESSVPHDVAIESPGGEQIGKTDVITESTASTTVELEPGEYTFYCTVPGHREAGMEGTLTVK